MLADILSHPFWLWLILGGVLLVLEMFSTSGYLLWSGLAALAVGLIAWLMPASWAVQGTLFAVLTLLSLWLWYRWLRRRERQPASPVMNRRDRQLIGLTLTLDRPLVNGVGQVTLGDGSWRVQAGQPLAAGTRVRVTGVEGITLLIEAC